jgi:hypothetical protein
MVVGCDTGGWNVDTDVSEKHTATIFTAEVSVKMKTLFSRVTARCYRVEIRNRNPTEKVQTNFNSTAVIVYY